MALVILIAGATWVIALWINFPHDELKEDITMDEAQSLVIFPICVPAYLSPKVDASYEIIDEADDAKVPEVTYIRLRYQGSDDKNKVLEIYQRYTPHEGLNSNPNLESAKVNLLYWMLPLRAISESKIKAAMKQAQITASFSKTGETIWWFYEITDPSEYRSTMTTWVRNHVEYRVLSYLPAEEIKKITLSMFKCSDQ